VFEKHRAKQAQQRYEQALGAWQSELDAYEELLALAQSDSGIESSELMLQPDEHLIGEVTGASLIEDRRGRGTYQGASHGVSIPIGSIGGRSVRYRVGATRGHYVQGAPVPTSIDVGTVFVTNKRIVFEGPKQTRECAFSKLLGVEHDDAEGSSVFSVSNRQKPTTIHYGSAVAGWFDARVDIALAQFRGTTDALLAQLRDDISTIEQSKPQPPPTGPP